MMPTTVYVNYYGWGCTNDFCFTAAGINKSMDRGASWFELAQLLYPDNWVSAQPYVSPVAIDPLRVQHPLRRVDRVLRSVGPLTVSKTAGSVRAPMVERVGYRVSDLGAGALSVRSADTNRPLCDNL